MQILRMKIWYLKVYLFTKITFQINCIWSEYLQPTSPILDCSSRESNQKYLCPSFMCDCVQNTWETTPKL